MSRFMEPQRDACWETPPRYLDVLRKQLNMASEHFKAARGTTEPGQASPCSTDAPREAAETSQPEVEEAAPRRSTWLEKLQLRPSADPADDDPIVFLDASCGGSSAGRICMRLFDLLHWRAAEAVRARCEDGEVRVLAPARRAWPP